MPQQGYTYTPEITTDESGRDVYSGEGTLTATRTGQAIAPPIEVNDMTGESRYLIDQQDYAKDGDAVPDIDDEYVQSIFEAYPDYKDAMNWMLNAYPPEFIEGYNQAMESLDPDDFMPLIEQVMGEYRESGSAPVNEEQTPTQSEENPLDLVTDEEWNEIDQLQVSEDWVTEHMTDFVEQPVLGQEAAYEWLQIAEQTQDSHPVYSAVCQATAAFHNGDATAQEAIVHLINNYPKRELIEVVNYINNTRK